MESLIQNILVRRSSVSCGSRGSDPKSYMSQTNQTLGPTQQILFNWGNRKQTFVTLEVNKTVGLIHQIVVVADTDLGLIQGLRSPWIHFIRIGTVSPHY